MSVWDFSRVSATLLNVDTYYLRILFIIGVVIIHDLPIITDEENLYVLR